MPTSPTVTASAAPQQLRRTLTLWHLIIYGIIVVQPVAPMPSFGVITQEARGHAVTCILIAMVAMLLTAFSYGRMARAYPSAGSAYTYVGRELHPALGYATGWSMTMDYILNPLICTIWCSKAAGNILPDVPYAAWVVLFAALFTGMNLLGVKTNARVNAALAAGMGAVIIIVLAAAFKYILHSTDHSFAAFTRPFYDPTTFAPPAVLHGTSIAVLTYIGFDGISTLSEEAENPRKNILYATVLVCLITGVLASVEVYAAQLVWPAPTFPDIDTAYVHVAGRMGGLMLFHLVNITLLVANIGSGMGAQLAAARLLYGMGRDNAIPKSFFGIVEGKHGIPRNNVLFVGVLALVGAFALTYERGAELLNFGAFIAFMGVNAAAFFHYYLRAEQKRLRNLFPPVLGFCICLVIWMNLSWQAKIAGAVWLFLGIVYGAYKTGGFRKKTISFDVPE